MPRLAGQQIEEMADINASKKRKNVLLYSAICVAIMVTFSLVRFIEQNYLLASINLAFSIILTANLFYTNSNANPKFSGLILSSILLCFGVLLLFYGQSVGDRLLWLYPILAIIVFANEFKSGALVSTLFIAIVMSAVLFFDVLSYTANGPHGIFLFSLLALYILCNASSYQHSKVMGYVQSLYKEGIEDLAYLDHLTGLANRHSFENWATEKLKEKQDSSNITAMVFLDIDNFKLINDTHGHDVGDKVLQHFAQRLKNNIRQKDRRTDKYDYSIARFAGDEFVLLLYDVKSKRDLEGILDRICNLFTHSYQASEKIEQLTISAGVAIYPDDANTLAELTRCADKAMYAAKHGGKSRFHFYRPEANNQTQRKEKAAKLASVTSIKQG
ncbi:diguanylate cyclase [Vibrio tubiashii]|nr:diguanylate cyclase [Vibrio tubiashii]